MSNVFHDDDMAIFALNEQAWNEDPYADDYRTGTYNGNSTNNTINNNGKRVNDNNNNHGPNKKKRSKYWDGSGDENILPKVFATL